MRCDGIRLVKHAGVQSNCEKADVDFDCRSAPRQLPSESAHWCRRRNCFSMLSIGDNIGRSGCLVSAIPPPTTTAKPSSTSVSRMISERNRHGMQGFQKLDASEHLMSKKVRQDMAENGHCGRCRHLVHVQRFREHSWHEAVGRTVLACGMIRRTGRPGDGRRGLGAAAKGMMRTLPLAGFLMMAMEHAASAHDIVASRPGVMCTSSQALARLTLPSGDSRTHLKPTIQKYLDIAAAGGCRDLQIGERLDVVKSFTNTVIVSLENEGIDRNPITLVAPIIDFDLGVAVPRTANASAVGSQSGEILSEASPAADPIMDVPIGMRQTDFVRIHGAGSCVTSADGGQECYYSGQTKSNCPAEFSCYATIYEFMHGVLVAFHTQLAAESDWVQLYRLTLATFGSPITRTATWGMSTSFNTNVGVLDFARKAGPPPSWHVTLNYRPSAEPSRE